MILPGAFVPRYLQSRATADLGRLTGRRQYLGCLPRGGVPPQTIVAFTAACEYAFACQSQLLSKAGRLSLLNAHCMLYMERRQA